jgi:small subunit ribosomal protein S9
MTAPAEELAGAPPAEEAAVPTAAEPAPDKAPTVEPSADAETLAATPAAQEPAADGGPNVEARPAAEPPAPEPTSVDEPAGERIKPAIPGADLEVDIVPEGSDPLLRDQGASQYDEDAVLEVEPEPEAVVEEVPPTAEAPSPKAAIDLASGARYIATGKRKTAVARVILKPGAGEYTVNGKALEAHFPRHTAQRNIRQPLETVGYESRMDVVAKLHGGGISAQAGALRHGIARALIEADPNLRVELKRRGFLTRDSRAKERRKAGLKKARKRPQFSKR